MGSEASSLYHVCREEVVGSEAGRDTSAQEKFMTGRVLFFFQSN